MYYCKRLIKIGVTLSGYCQQSLDIGLYGIRNIYGTRNLGVNVMYLYSKSLSLGVTFPPNQGVSLSASQDYLNVPMEKKAEIAVKVIRS